MSRPDEPARHVDAEQSTLPSRFRDATRSLSTRLQASDNPVARRLGTVDRVTTAVAGFVLVGLILRLAYLGARTAHYDEGRVGYWILHFVETGEFHYRFIIHGPFVQHVNRAVFELAGANDFTLRLAVALIGAFLPLAALLLREHLDGPEVVAAAFFLALDPALLYYSRFLRSTVPVAAFAFVAFALLVRFVDTRRFRYFHGAAFFVALAFTAKENAAVYLLVWIGAAALLLDHALFRPGSEESGIDRLRDWWARNTSEHDWRTALARYAGHTVLAAALFFVVTLYFYAPRAAGPEDVGLWRSLAAGEIGPLVSETWRTVADGYGWWFGGGLDSGEAYETLGDRFVDYFGAFGNTLLSASGPLVAFAAVGFLVERYASRRRRSLVMFASYWGFVSVIGYPLGADIYGAAWTTVNVVVPLAIPAAVGIALIYRWGLDARADDDAVGVGLVGVVLALVVLQVAVTGISSAFVSHSAADNSLVQYGQPADDLKPTLRDVEALAAANEGTDVLFYGDFLVDEGQRSQIQPSCADISNTLPLQWYLERAGATADCAATEDDLSAALADDPPPVVVVEESAAGPVAEQLPEYERRTLFTRTHIDRLTFFVDTDRLADAESSSS